MLATIYVITTLVSVFLYILHFLMLVRAIISWLPLDDESSIVNFVYSMTEPVIYPVRLVLERFEFVNSAPIDISFFVAFMLLSVVQLLLPSVI